MDMKYVLSLALATLVRLGLGKNIGVLAVSTLTAASGEVRSMVSRMGRRMGTGT